MNPKPLNPKFRVSSCGARCNPRTTSLSLFLSTPSELLPQPGRPYYRIPYRVPFQGSLKGSNYKEGIYSRVL